MSKFHFFFPCPRRNIARVNGTFTKGCHATHIRCQKTNHATTRNASDLASVSECFILIFENVHTCSSGVIYSAFLFEVAPLGVVSALKWKIRGGGSSASFSFHSFHAGCHHLHFFLRIELSVRVDSCCKSAFLGDARVLYGNDAPAAFFLALAQLTLPISILFATMVWFDVCSPIAAAMQCAAATLATTACSCCSRCFTTILRPITEHKKKARKKRALIR